MTRLKNLIEFAKWVKQVQPVDINGAAQGGNYNFVSIRNYQSAAFLLSVGVHSGDAVAFTVQQAKNVEGNGAKSLAYDLYFRNLTSNSPVEESDKWLKHTGASGTFNIAAQSKYIVPIRPGELDVSNDFDCIRGHLAAGSASTLISLDLLLWGGPEGITGNVIHIPSANVNRMPN